MLPKDASGKSKYFEGTPVPFACLTSCAVMALWVWQGNVHERIPLGVVLAGKDWVRETELLVGKYVAGGGVLGGVHVVSVMWVVLGSLMVSKTLKVPKP